MSPTLNLTWFDFLILALALLYSVQVITTKSGPFGVFGRLRSRFPESDGGNVLHCVWCLAPWAAVVLLLTYLFLPYGVYPVYILALCGAAMVIRIYSGVQHG